MKTYMLTVTLSKQEDGLWRAEAPELPGCFADAPTIAQVLADIQECAAMMIDLRRERKQSLPAEVALNRESSLNARLPVVVEEHSFEQPIQSRKAPS